MLAEKGFLRLSLPVKQDVEDSPVGQAVAVTLNCRMCRVVLESDFWLHEKTVKISVNELSGVIAECNCWKCRG